MTLRADLTPAELERDSLVLELRNKTALGRLNHTETHDVFNMITTLGYVVTKIEAPAPIADTEAPTAENA